MPGIVYPNPPIPVPSGQTVIWSTAGTVTPYVGNPSLGSVTADLTTATLQEWGSRPLGDNQVSATWGSFVVPSILSGVTIHGAYPTIVVNGDVNHTYASWENFTSTYPWTAAPGVFSGEYHANSIGTTVAAIEAHTSKVQLIQSLFENWSPNDILNATFLGIAIYADQSRVPFPIQQFVDPSGVPIANGSIRVRLSDPAKAPTGEIYTGSAKVPLDSNGTIVGDPLFWPNEWLSPSNTVYVVDVYANDGQLAAGSIVLSVGEGI